MSAPDNKATIVECPTCKKEVAWLKGSKWKPFCSERCKLIDLGAWADESYSIAGESVMPESLEDTNH
jgi:endogenous inhibitor of DNA gyrase (YacG/DUF329 family)